MMSNKRSLIEAIELFKEFRNHAQAASDAQLDLIAFMIDKVSEVARIPREQRKPEEQAIFDFYGTFIDKVDFSLNKSDQYNKSLSKYVKGINILHKLASSKDEIN